jgi:hypothetical protein
MKNLISCIFALFFVVSAFAQKARIENFSDYRTETYTFQKGRGDSVQFKLQNKTDTILTSFFYRNGKISKTIGKDSNYHFDIKGRIRMKDFVYDTIRENYDSSMIYYTNGNIQEIRSNVKGRKMMKRFDDDGSVQLFQYETSTPSVTWERLEYGDGKLINLKRQDSILVDNKKIARNYDTMYYSNGQIYATQGQHESGDKIESLGTKYFKKDGSLLDTELPDSLQLQPFKDNVDCYYGLKNRRGDTIMRPQFDHIRFRNANNSIMAYTGDVCKLFTLDGKPMPQPTERLSGIYPIAPINTYFSRNTDYDTEDLIERVAQQKQVNYIGFVEDSHKFGVMTKEGKIVIPAQLLQIEGNEIGGGRFFSFSERLGDSTLAAGFMDRRGKPIFSNFKHVQYSGYDDYFILSTTFMDGRYRRPVVGLKVTFQNQTFGLGRGGVETMVFEPKFERISYYAHLQLFMAKLSKPKKDSKEKDEDVHGIYNPRLNKWILEANDYTILNTEMSKNHIYFVLKNIKTGKYCVMDTTGKFIVSPSMSLDSIGVMDDVKGRFWVKKKDKYQFLDIKNGKASLRSTAYEYLERVAFSDRYGGGSEDEYTYFLAKQKGKWGFINPDESIVKPFDYDYAAKAYDGRRSEWGVFLVKNDQVNYFNLASLPFENPDLPFHINEESEAKSLFSFGLVENSKSVFFINDTGKVIIPPQYKRVNMSNGAGFILVEDAQQHRKIIFTETGKTVDMPFNYRIQLARPKSSIIVVRDSLDNTFGVVSTSGKELIPCANYGVAVGDFDKSIFFVKRDTPKIQRYVDDDIRPLYSNPDSLSIEDANWVMHNGEGKVLDAQSFRFPIDFEGGIGIGMQGDDFNLYNTEGVIITPYLKDKTAGVERNFNNIRRVQPHSYYALYRNQGLTPTMMLTDSSGKILIESGRYDGISNFFGKYALVSTRGLIGMIDSLGKEIVAPQDLWTAKTTFMDSLNQDKQVFHSKWEENADFDYSSPFMLNTGAYDFKTDSLKVTETQRATLLNLMVQKNISFIVNTAQFLQIPRNYSSVDGNFVQYDRKATYQFLQLKRLAITDKTIAFTWTDSDGTDTKYFNFKKQNDRWTEKNLYDILDLQGEKRWALNDLLNKKIKALKDVSIDCSNSGAFIKQAEEAFLLTEKGIDFCFVSDDYENNLVVIPFDWAELKPFLK